MKKECFKYLYFLEYNYSNNSFDYPDIDTFRDLYNKFYFNDNSLSFDLNKALVNIKKGLSGININVAPLIKTVGGLLTISLVISMCGCTQIDKLESNSTTSSSIVSEVDALDDLYDYFKSNGIEIIDRQYSGEGYIFVREFINSDNKKQITLQDNEEFRKFKNIDFVPSWEDVRTAFKNNDNIDDNARDIILSSLVNMENCSELKDFDLSVLYVNAKRMNFKYLSSEELKNRVNRDSVYAYFDTVTGTVYLPSDAPLKKFEFIHEVLGHGSLAYREETDDSLIVFDCTNHLMLPEGDKYSGYSLGVMVSEGGANMIAHFATDDYSVDSFYNLFEEELRVISDLCDVSVGELFNHKGISMYDLMYQNNINTPVEYIFKMDGICKGKLYCDFSDLMERLFVDATEEEFVKADGKKQDEIISSTVKIIKNSYFSDNDELRFDYNGGSIKYNFKDSAVKYKENMDQVRGKR